MCKLHTTWPKQICAVTFIHTRIKLKWQQVDMLCFWWGWWKNSSDSSEFIALVFYDYCIYFYHFDTLYSCNTKRSHYWYWVISIMVKTVINCGSSDELVSSDCVNFPPFPKKGVVLSLNFSLSFFIAGFPSHPLCHHPLGILWCRI